MFFRVQLILFKDNANERKKQMKVKSEERRVKKRSSAAEGKTNPMEVKRDFRRIIFHTELKRI